MEQRVKERTTALRPFLYVLLRDHLTLGEFEKLMRDAHTAWDKGADFSNEHLIGYVDEIMERIV